jgi:hypothetical protein
MNTRYSTILVMAVLLLLAAAAAVASECEECHKSLDFKVKNPKLFYYYSDFQQSVHGLAKLACTDCHDGDDSTKDLDKAHLGVLDPVRFDLIPETCGKCHEAQHDAFVTSDHSKILEDYGNAPNCVTCHGAMDMDFIFASRVKDTCAFCHNVESGIVPGVPDRADYVLSKLNVMKGYKTFVDTHLKDKARAAELHDAYGELTAKWHYFQLDDIETETKALLGQYREAKAQAVKDRTETSR